MIRRAELVQYDRPAESGRTGPLRVQVETEDGESHEAFLKPPGRREMTIEGAVMEAFTVCLAGLLKLPVCEPFLVDLDAAWVAALRDQTLRRELELCTSPAFASKSAGTQWRAWSSDDRISAALTPTALAIVAFDGFIDNPDRRPGNPNLLVKGDELRLIDHEAAFARRKLFPFLKPPPQWTIGGLSWLTEGDGRHVLALALKSRGPFDVSAIAAAWAGITKDDLDAIVSSLPAEWALELPAAKAAAAHVIEVRDRIDDCLKELHRVLT